MLSDHEDDGVDPEGELELEFRLYLERADGGSVPLSDADLQVELDLEGTLEADVIQVVVPAERYSGLRIVFTEIDVDVTAGVIIGGVPILGFIDVELEGPGLEVTRPLDLEIVEGSTVELLLDLNAATWLALTDPALRTVTAEHFAEAFSVRVR